MKQWHSCRVHSVDDHFRGKDLNLRRVFEALVRHLERSGPLRIDAVKSTINLVSHHHFAGVSVRREHLRAGFILDHEIDDERIARSAQRAPKGARAWRPPSPGYRSVLQNGNPGVGSAASLSSRGPMRLLNSMVLLSCLAGSAAHAQGTLVVSQNKCDSDKQGQVRQLTDSLWLPIAQELVNEGKLLAAGSAYHAWGDEWNVLVWYTATDIPTFLSAFNDLIRRVSQRHPTLFPQFQSWCSEHKDSMYGMGRATTPVTPPAPPARE